MDIVLWALGCLAGLVVLLYCVGFALPSRYRGQATFELPRGPAEVWEAIADIRANPMGGAMTRDVDEHRPGEPGPGQPSWTENLGSTRVRVTTAEAEPPLRLVRDLEDLVVPMTSRWEFALEGADGASTRLTIVNDIRIGLGTWHAPLFRVILKLSRGAERGVQHYGARLQAHLAQAPVSGEPVS